MPSNASQHFTGLCQHVDQLVSIHAKVQKGKGRRHHQEALHRAGVVLVVAAWEGYVEALAGEAYEALKQHYLTLTPRPWMFPPFALYDPIVLRDIKSLHTANTDNVAKLFITAIGFDPTAGWSWSSPRRQWDAKKCRNQVNKWLQVRHCVAHGAALPTDFPDIKDKKGRPRLNLHLMKACKRDFAGFVKQTDQLVRDHLVAVYGVPSPW